MWVRSNDQGRSLTPFFYDERVKRSFVKERAASFFSVLFSSYKSSN